MPRRALAFVPVVLAMLACTPSAPGPSATPPPPSAAASTSAAPSSPLQTSASADDPQGLHVELHLLASHVARLSDLRVTVVLTNRGSTPRRLHVEYVPAGSLSLEVQDPGGQRVAPMPPPTPRVDDGVAGWATLAPGESRSFGVGSGIGIDTPGGRYRVRFTGIPADPTAGHLQTPWLAFDVSP